MSPQVGTISSSGLYTAPAGVNTQQIVTVQASSAANPSSTASVAVTLKPPPTSFTPIRVNCGGYDYTDPQGRLWAKDYGFTNTGGTAISDSPISGASIP